MNWNKNYADFAKLFEPDADFEKRIQSIGKVTIEEEKKPSIFDGFDIDASLFDANIAQTKTLVEWIMWISPTAHQVKNTSNVLEKKQEEIYLSELEKKFPFYADKFQKLLTLTQEPTLEDLVKRYARILLYISEQFEISGNRKEQIKLMLKLKKVLWEIGTWEEELVYTNLISNKTSLIRTSGDLKKEIELLYHIYHSNYSHTQEELHRIQTEREKSLRTEIISRINIIEQEMLPEPNSFIDPVTKMRQRIKQKRLSRA